MKHAYNGIVDAVLMEKWIKLSENLYDSLVYFEDGHFYKFIFLQEVWISLFRNDVIVFDECIGMVYFCSDDWMLCV